MRVYDQIAAVVKSGGKTRRAAKMQSLKVEHPDIMDFIECKAKEENKARVLIEKGGYEANFNGEAYSSILFQNANLSVRVSDNYMRAVEQDEPWTTHWVTKPDREGPSFQARELMNRMAQCAWQCGDPGVQYDTTINRWNTCPNSGRINASNPCVTGETLVSTGGRLSANCRISWQGSDSCRSWRRSPVGEPRIPNGSEAGLQADDSFGLSIATDGGSSREDGQSGRRGGM